jgi:PAS domain S-box-containing protein
MSTKITNSKPWRSAAALFSDFLNPSWPISPAITTEEEMRKAKLLSKIVIATFVTSVIGLVLGLQEPKNDVKTTVSFYTVTFFALGIIFILLRYGKVKTAGLSLVIFLWLIVAFPTLFFEGLHTQVPVVFVVAIMLMGTIFGGMAAFILSLFTIFFLGVVAYLEIHNSLPPQLGPDYSPLNAWTGLCVSFLLMSLLLSNLLASIKESQLRYQLALRGSAAGLWDWNTITNEVYYAPGFKEMLGYSPNEFPGEYASFFEALHPDDRELTTHLVKIHFESPASRFDAEFRLRTRSGEYQWFHSRGEAVRDEKGNPYRMVGSITDITVRKQAEESIVLKNAELVKINAELDSFVYSASHDLRAPISSLLGLIRVARLESDPSSIMKLLDMQERSLRKLDKFIYDIVNYSRNNRVAIEITPIDFTLLIDETFEQLQHMEQFEKIQRTIQIDRSIDFHSDPKRLSILLNNLISNAIKYNDITKANPFIRIEVKKTDQGVAIHVADSGEGMSPDHIPKIFDMFYRGSLRSVGSGIGLYIVKEVVLKLNGTIRVHSEKGEGSEFIVELPHFTHADESISLNEKSAV